MRVSKFIESCAVFIMAGTITSAAPIIRQGEGADAASIQAVVDQFRADLGGSNNGNTPGFLPDGRREINWDGGGDAAPSTVFPIPMTTFSARGNVNVTAGTGLGISGQPLPEFGEINPTYPDIFTTFSSPRLFAALGSNVLDALVTKPGTTDVQARSKGYGVVFTDVDLADTSTVEFYDIGDNLLMSVAATPFSNGLSFVGVTFDFPVVSRVRITSGNTALGPNDGGSVDVVALDDFIYGEPQAVPEPTTSLLVGLSALAGVGVLRRSRKRLI